MDHPALYLPYNSPFLVGLTGGFLKGILNTFWPHEQEISTMGYDVDRKTHCRGTIVTRHRVFLRDCGRLRARALGTCDPTGIHGQNLYRSVVQMHKSTSVERTPIPRRSYRNRQTTSDKAKRRNSSEKTGSLLFRGRRGFLCAILRMRFRHTFIIHFRSSLGEIVRHPGTVPSHEGLCEASEF